jgi:hypothetical protein
LHARGIGAKKEPVLLIAVSIQDEQQAVLFSQAGVTAGVGYHDGSRFPYYVMLVSPGWIK